MESMADPYMATSLLNKTKTNPLVFGFNVNKDSAFVFDALGDISIRDWIKWHNNKYLKRFACGRLSISESRVEVLEVLSIKKAIETHNAFSVPVMIERLKTGGSTE